MIHRLAIPTPFRVGPVNCYLVEDDPLTLVDVGPNSGASLVALEDALREHGHRIEDLERIVITHHHTDHLGLVGILAERSGADVCALDLLAPVVEDFAGYAERSDELARALMARNGIEPDVVTALVAVSRAYRGWGGSAPVTRHLQHGGELGFAGRTLRGAAPPRALARRHGVLRRRRRHPDRRRSPDQADLLEPADRAAARRRASGRPRALLTYLASMRETQRMPVTTVLPGHGEPFGDHAALDRRPVRDARAAGGQDPRPARGAALGARDRAGDLGQRRGHAGVPDAERGARPRRPAAGARRGRRDRARTASCGSAADKSRSSS